MDDTLVGMIGRRKARKPGVRPGSRSPADYEDQTIQVLGMVGPSHYLVQYDGQRHQVIAEIGTLMRFAWFETREVARSGDAAEPESDDA